MKGVGYKKVKKNSYKGGTCMFAHREQISRGVLNDWQVLIMNSKENFNLVKKNIIVF